MSAHRQGIASPRSEISRPAHGIGAILALVVLVLIYAPVAASDPAPGAATPGAEEASYLFVQIFANGTWQPSSEADDVYLLTLNDIGAETIYFTDRPVHRAGLVPTVDFLASLGFTAGNPPNAVLMARADTGELDVLVIELNDPAYHEASGTLTYDAVLLMEYDEAALADLAERATDAEMPASFGSGQLFIDSSRCDPDDWEHCIII